MILKFILNIMGTIISILINIALSVLPTTGLGDGLGEIIAKFLEITQQGLNLLYLIFGDTFFLIMTILPAYLVFKFAFVPIFMAIRSFFLNSTE